MSDFGGKLRLARERRGISLRQIASSTKIPIAALEALERNDLSKLPGGIFSRAFVRSYAVEVGLNPDDTVREFLERFHDVAPPAAGPGVVPDEDSNFENHRRVAGVALKLALVSIPLIAGVLYFALRSRPADAVPDAPETAIAAVPSQTAPDEVAAAARAVAPTASAPAGPAAVSTPAPKSMRLELHPTGDCWIRLTIDGRPALSRVMLAGERIVQEVRETVVIEVGDAGAFAFSVDGRLGKPLGETGQVRTARITRASLAQYLQ